LFTLRKIEILQCSGGPGALCVFVHMCLFVCMHMHVHLCVFYGVWGCGCMHVWMCTCLPAHQLWHWSNCSLWLQWSVITLTCAAVTLPGRLSYTPDLTHYSVLLTAKNDEKLKNRINCTLDYVTGWFSANGLALNKEKRNIMKFTSSYHWNEAFQIIYIKKRQ